MIYRGLKKKIKIGNLDDTGGRRKDNTHSVVFVILLKGIWCWQKGLLWGILSIHRQPWPCTARLCALCAQSAKFLACSPLPYGQRWYVCMTEKITSFARQGGFTQSPTAWLAIARATSNESRRIAHLMISMTVMRMKHFKLSTSSVPF